MEKEIDFISIARKTIEIEIEAIEALKAEINDDFEKCVRAIFASKGRVVITGVGKSALVAQKIVATLNSTGTAAIFMHAVDAIHGDLGMIRHDDIVLCISKSGDSPEVKVLLPLIRKFGNLLIGMVGSKQSYLGRHAKLILHTPISKEADPNNLAPTASTTAQMVMGDALAMALLALRGFTPSDFALIHPGGMLGKQLILNVDDLFTENEKPQVGPDANIRTVIMEMTSKRLGATAVIDEAQRLLGIITDGDLRRMLEEQDAVKELTAKEIMTANPKSISVGMLAVKALEEMRNHSISQLIVVDGETYKGIIHLHDLVREGLL